MFNLKNIAYKVSLFVLVLIASSSIQAATYYVDVSVADDNGDGSQATPKKYIGSGLGLMSSAGGDTVIIMPGTYANANDKINSSFIANGQPGAYNVVKAQTDGTVTIDAPFNLFAVGAAQSSYLQFEGLKWRGSMGKSIVGHHIKILRCAFEGGPPNGNTVTFGIGTNNQSPGASDILVEDSWFYGKGGRYRFLVFNAERVVLRRVVTRNDHGWCFTTDCSNPNGPPQANITIYNSRNIRLQNVMAIDSNLVYNYWESNFYIINNNALFDNDNTVVEGSLSINNRGSSFKFDGPKAVTNAVIKDSVTLGLGDGTGFGIALTGNPGSDSVLQNLTLLNAGTGVLVGSSATTNNLTNSIVAGNTRAFMDNSGPSSQWSHSYNNCSNNGNNNTGSNNCNATGESKFDAFTGGLLYPVRVEAGSALETAGNNNTRVGASIVFKLGTSGSLYSEPGSVAATTEPLWPWPLEGRMKMDMCNSVSTGVADRGWCATNKPLTQYIWELLGNAMPDLPGVVPTMSAPKNVKSTKIEI